MKSTVRGELSRGYTGAGRVLFKSRARVVEHVQTFAKNNRAGKEAAKQLMVQRIDSKSKETFCSGLRYRCLAMTDLFLYFGVLTTLSSESPTKQQFVLVSRLSVAWASCLPGDQLVPMITVLQFQLIATHRAVKVPAVHFLPVQECTTSLKQSQIHT